MTQQVPLDPSALAAATTDHGVHAVADDVAYTRLALVNVVFSGPPGAPDRGWVLIDAGVIGTTARLVAAASSAGGQAARLTALVRLATWVASS